MNNKCTFTEATCKYAHEDTSKVPVCPDWYVDYDIISLLQNHSLSVTRNGVAGSCKKYHGWCNLFHPDIKQSAQEPAKVKGGDLFPALTSGDTEPYTSDDPREDPDKPRSSAAATSYAETVKREVSPPMLRAPPSPATSHAVSTT